MRAYKITPEKGPLTEKYHLRSPAWWQLLLSVSIGNDSNLQEPATLSARGVSCPRSYLTHPTLFPWAQDHNLSPAVWLQC